MSYQLKEFVEQCATAERWLKEDPIEAWRILYKAPMPQAMSREAWTRWERLCSRIAQTAEVSKVMDAVYDPDFPVELRFIYPAVLPKRNADRSEIHSWYPARVVSSAVHDVELEMASMDIGTVPLFSFSFQADEWGVSAGSPCEDAEGYVFVAMYCDKSYVIRKQFPTHKVLSCCQWAESDNGYGDMDSVSDKSEDYERT